MSLSYSSEPSDKSNAGVDTRRSLGSPEFPRPGVAISIQSLSKRYSMLLSWRELVRHPFRRKSLTALDRVSVQIQRGELFAVLGPNGAGKTTLFRLLATLVLPDGGQARIMGHDVVQEPAVVRQKLALVLTEERSLYWRVSTRENLRLYGVLYGLRGAGLDRRIDEVLDLVELTQAGTQPAAELSSGMKQRLLLGRALMGRPSVLLLDEPTRSLDPVSAKRIRTFLRDTVSGDLGCTVVLATHNSEEALELADRVGVLNRGRLLAVGTPDELGAHTSERRFTIETTRPDHPIWSRLGSHGLLRIVPSSNGIALNTAGWSSLEAWIPGGAEGAAAVLAALVEAGVPIAGFDKARASLANLLEHVVRERGGD